MKVYRENTEFAAGKFRIIIANLDKDDYSWKNTINVPYTVIEIDEVDPDNKVNIIDVAKSATILDSSGEGKYYINSLDEVVEKDGWLEDLPPEGAFD